MGNPDFRKREFQTLTGLPVILPLEERTLKQELTSLEGWVELTKDALVLDFHAHHSRAGRSTIPYTVIERVEIVSITKQGWLSAKKIGSGIRAVRFDREGYAEEIGRASCRERVF